MNGGIPKTSEGVDEAYAKRLESVGIATVDDMLERAATPSDRALLAQETGVPLEAITEYTKLSDLSRVGALKAVRARLYYDAGVDTIDKLAAWGPEELRRMFVAYVERTGFSGIAPLQKEIRNAVTNARKIERRVTFE